MDNSKEVKRRSPKCWKAQIVPVPVSSSFSWRAKQKAAIRPVSGSPTYHPFSFFMARIISLAKEIKYNLCVWLCSWLFLLLFVLIKYRQQFAMPQFASVARTLDMVALWQLDNRQSTVELALLVTFAFTIFIVFHSCC